MDVLSLDFQSLVRLLSRGGFTSLMRIPSLLMEQLLICHRTMTLLGMDASLFSFSIYKVTMKLIWLCYYWLESKVPKTLPQKASSKGSQKLDCSDLTDPWMSLLSLFSPSPQKYTLRFTSSTGKMKSVAKINVQ